MDRTTILEQVRTRKGPWDIVVIGGGATGVGCAVDAASRGFEVLLLEQHDFGKGTSSRSTKLIHGGVRYLAQGNIPLVREALRERGILLRNAPHVVHEQDFIVPCFGQWQKLYYGAGLKMYDLLAGWYSSGRSRILSRRETLERLPNAKADGLSGGILYTDCQFDDTRLLIDLVRAAHERGAAVLNYAKVIGIEKDDRGKADGLLFEDALSREKFRVAAKAIINAAGAFCDDIRKLSEESAEKIVTLSQGTHIVVDRKFLNSAAAMLIPNTADGRVLFCIPWHGHVLIGTTDIPVERASLEPLAQENEVDFILEAASGYLAHQPARKDILSVFAGIRPLVRTAGNLRTSSLPRGHLIDIDTAGVLTITGGKWTTYRRMAEDAVDTAARSAGLPARPCVTEELRIRPSTGGVEGKPLHEDLPYRTSDVIAAVRAEMAQTLEDVLARRTRCLFLNASASIEAAPMTAAVIAAELNKDGQWIDAQVRSFKETASHYLAED